MTFDRSKFKGSDILHSIYQRIDFEYNELYKFYEFTKYEFHPESNQLLDINHESISFESDLDESHFFPL